MAHGYLMTLGVGYKTAAQAEETGLGKCLSESTLLKLSPAPRDLGPELGCNLD